MRIEVYGDKGLMFFERHGGGWQVFDESEKVIAQERPPPALPIWTTSSSASKSRKRPTPTSRRATCPRYSARSATFRIVSAAATGFDGKSETFVSDAEANQLLKRPGRDPWVIPDVV